MNAASQMAATAAKTGATTTKRMEGKRKQKWRAASDARDAAAPKREMPVSGGHQAAQESWSPWLAQ
jgi:hypothetical protein